MLRHSFTFCWVVGREGLEKKAGRECGKKGRMRILWWFISVLVNLSD